MSDNLIKEVLENYVDIEITLDDLAEYILQSESKYSKTHKNLRLEFNNFENRIVELVGDREKTTEELEHDKKVSRIAAELRKERELQEYLKLKEKYGNI